VRSLLGTMGGDNCIFGGVAGYNKPIWDVLALQGEREEAGECLYGAKLINFFPIRQAVPDGLAWARFCCWARWARFFIEKTMYISKYNTYTSILPIYMAPGRGEWMDAFGSIQMTLLWIILS
jgi:hypothetical protein